MADLGEIFAAGASVVGGTVVIAAGIAYFVSKLVADGLVETHKASLLHETERLKAQLTQEGDRVRLGLKKQELVFAKELEAGAAYMKLHREIAPKYSFPDMDWHDACAAVADKFGTHGEKLEAFLLAHGAIVSSAVRKEIFRLRALAETHKFDQAGEGEYSKAALDAAGQIIEALPKIEERIIQDIRTWDSEVELG